MEVDGREEIVREPDGIHLNQTGSGLAADQVEEALERDFTYWGLGCGEGRVLSPRSRRAAESLAWARVV